MTSYRQNFGVLRQGKKLEVQNKENENLVEIMTNPPFLLINTIFQCNMITNDR